MSLWMLPSPGPQAFNYIKQLLQYLDADSGFFLVSRWTKRATNQCHWLKNVECDRREHQWQLSGEVTEKGSLRDGSPPHLYRFLGLCGAMYHRIWWRCNCSTHWLEGDNLGMGPHQLRFSGWIALLHSNGVSTAGRASQQKLQFGLLVCGVVCVPFVWLNVALLGTAGWGQKDPASAEGKPVVYCLLCLSAATPGIWRD